MKININFNTKDEMDKQQEDELKTKIRERIEEIITFCSDRNMLHDSIIEICITDEYRNAIIEKSKTFGREEKTSIGRTQKGASKYIFNGNINDPQFIIILDIFFVTHKDFYYLLIYQIVEIFFKNNLPDKIKNDVKYNTNSTFDDIIKFLCHGWYQTYLTCHWMASNGLIKKDILEQPLEEFKIQLKDIHYEYQNTLKLNLFWFKVVSKLSFFVSLFIQSHFDGNNYSDFGVFEFPMKSIINDLHLLSYKQSSEFSLLDLKQHVKDFLKLCYIEIDEESPLGIKYDNGLKITISENPKLLFKREIKHTEDCIVAFIDILGFKNLINEYDNNPESNVLQRLQKSLNDSINAINHTKNINPLHSKVLDYQMFSDCLCLSIPIYKTDEDFISEFNSMITIVTTYQFLMLMNGFFVRGGISIGSYYSDSSMIFSGGLVKSYEIESKKAINPLIQIDKNIIDRIKKLKKENNPIFNIEDFLVFEQTNYNKIFLNPFSIIDLISSTKKTLKNTFSELLGTELDSFIDTILSFSLKLIKDLIPNNIENLKQDMLSIIRNHTNVNLEEFKNDDNILQKYIWFSVFLDWYEKKNDFFKRLSDK